MNVSVAMAVYNGEKYLKEQLYSILNQLDENDEIIISYDKSSDKTLEIITEFAKFDNRITIVNGPCLGVIKNFENAIKYCKNKYIFLSDQDDIWLENKIKIITDMFNKTNADVIIHDSIVIDEKNNTIYPSFFAFRHCKKGVLYNIIHNSYIGCCMAMRNDFVKNIIPFPKNIPMHDQWIGLIANKKNSVEFINIPLLKYRRHSNNVSSFKHKDLFSMIRLRLNLIHALIKSKSINN